MKTEEKGTLKRMSVREFIGYLFLFAGIAMIVVPPIYRAATEPKPTTAMSYYFQNLQQTKVIGLIDLHENDLVVCEPAIEAGWVEIRIENARGEEQAKAEGSRALRLRIREQGDYVLLIAGDHLDGGINLTIYQNE